MKLKPLKNLKIDKPIPPRNKSKRIIKVNALSYAKLVLMMLDGTYNCKELAEMTGLHYVTVLQYARELHLSGAAHIHMWEKDSRGRDNIVVYKIGKNKDAKRSRLTPKERQARYRNKRRNSQIINLVSKKQELHVD